MATARCAVPVARNGRTVIRYIVVALDDEIRLDLGMLRAAHMVALAGYTPPAVTHGLGGSDDFTAVVGGVTQSDQIDHGLLHN